MANQDELQGTIQEPTLYVQVNQNQRKIHLSSVTIKDRKGKKYITIDDRRFGGALEWAYQWLKVGRLIPVVVDNGIILEAHENVLFEGPVKLLYTKVDATLNGTKYIAKFKKHDHEVKTLKGSPGMVRGTVPRGIIPNGMLVNQGHSVSMTENGVMFSTGTTTNSMG